MSAVSSPSAPDPVPIDASPIEPIPIDPESFFVAVGGEPTFRRLVQRFYEGVADDPPLRALYPETDLAGAVDRLTLFLIQYWGGPTTYSDQRGHPRLRMRHVPFLIDSAQRDRWLKHMRDAVDSLDLAPEHEAVLWRYLSTAAESMRNVAG
jgi:hemoglobin